jgi:hypothetical protein
MPLLEIAQIIEALAGAGKSIADIAQYFRDRHKAETDAPANPAPAAHAAGAASSAHVNNGLGDPYAGE